MRIRDLYRGLMPGAAVAGGLLVAALAPSDISAQDVDARWLPWLGCWEAAEAGTEGPLLCIRPMDEGSGVELLTWSEGKITSSEFILADGTPRDADRDGCLGVEEASFSDSGKRVFLRSQYVCEEGGEREITGILAMVNPVEWVDIKVLNEHGRQQPWVLRYRMARGARVEAAGMAGIQADRAPSIRSARIAVSSPLEPEDVIEASQKVAPEAVGALIVETGDPFDVDADMLVRLADAGVPQEVIDLAVAVSFPDRFALEARGPAEIEDERGAYRGVPMGSFGFYPRFSFWNPYFFDPFYSRFGYGYGYSPYYGYGYGGGYWGGWGGYYRPTTITVQPRGSIGRLVKGRGYTRGGSGSSSRGAAGRGSSGGSSSSGAVRSSGGSSSGSSSSGGRRAVRRGGGGGGI